MPSSPPRLGWGFGVYEDPVEGEGWSEYALPEEGESGEGKEVETGVGGGAVEKVVRGLRVDGNGRAVVDFGGLGAGAEVRK